MTDNQHSSSKPSNFKLWEGSSSFLTQGTHWSSSFIWISSALFTSFLIWASFAKVDQTISVRGTLDPEKSIREVDSPSSGVVESLFITEGQFVNEGDPLITLKRDALISRKAVVDERLRLIRYELLSLNAISDSPSTSSIVFPSIDTSDSLDPILLSKITVALNQSRQIVSQLEQLNFRLNSRTESLKLNKMIAADLKPLFDNGGLARNTYLRQLNSLQELKSEISSLNSEIVRIRSTVLSKINDLNVLQSSLNSELVNLNQQIDLRTISAPSSGTIFDLQVAPSSYLSSSESILKIVPTSRLSATVSISNKDIGFVKVGQAASISVDSFPSGEFGYISGKLISIGSDSLPPDSESPQVYFPATISLKEQSVLSGNQTLNLQSGMSVTANIKLRSRPVISIVTDIFTRQLDGIKRFR